MDLNQDMSIYTLGTGLRSEEEIVGILKNFQIEAFLDVRRCLKSKVRIFNRDHLEKLLLLMGIDYH